MTVASLTKRGRPRKERTSPIEKAVVLFSQLDPGQIAEFFEEHQVRGVRGETLDCAMVRCLYKLGATWAKANAKRLAWVEGDEDRERYYRMHTPPSVAEFMHEFDLGVYPTLVVNDHAG